MPGRSGDVRPTNLSTSFSREKKRKEETRAREKREQDLRQKRKKQDRESAMALTLPPTFAAEIREIVLRVFLSIGRSDDNYDRSDRAGHYLSCSTYDAALAKGYNTPPRLVL
ncbi:hypothetical protein G5I_07664 [Acromyrmex echinatior]|uniref:Uncharacterized protein n=1 Tax=Acromyrmex echinatior TaxID=103372 RepID=F4WPA1_ACREC|nr:hypothetical protein G5I_07664 [Acromyrmex echinatior]